MSGRAVDLAMTLGYCADCRHWRAYADMEQEEPGFGLLAPEDDEDAELQEGEKAEAKRVRQVGACMRVEHVERVALDKKPVGEERRAFVEDGSDYFARLRTRADFGCVLFAPLHCGSLVCAGGPMLGGCSCGCRDCTVAKKRGGGS